MLLIISLFRRDVSRMFISTEAVIYSMFVSTTVIYSMFVSTTVIYSMFVSTTVI